MSELTPQEVKELVLDALSDLKAKDVVELDVSDFTDVMDTLVIASGTSNRHVKSLAGNVSSKAKAAGFQPLGMEGEDQGEWVLVDFGDLVLHVMMPSTRDFYDLEKLWSMAPKNRPESAPSNGNLPQ
jgi:ribosome-associated protein